MSEPGRFSFRRFLNGPSSPRSPRRPLEALKTLTIVVPLTMLIWVYAEKAQSRAEDLVVRIAYASPDAKYAATLVDATNSVQVNLAGPSGQIDLFKAKLDQARVDGQLKVTLPAEYAAPGEKDVPIASALKLDPVFSNIGVTIKTNPAQSRVAVNPKDTRDVTVVPPQGLSVTLQNVSFEPDRVQVTGPRPAINENYGGEKPTIAVDASGLSIVPTATGPQTLTVPLVAPRDGQVTLSTTRVKMTFEVGSTIREGDIRSVFIDVRRPVAEDGQSKVTLVDGPVIFNVQIRGPSNLVSALIGDNPERPVKAVLLVTREDVDKGRISRAVELDLEPGVIATGPPREVTFEARSLRPDVAP